MKTSGNTILITGGGSGIGLELARAFLQAGNKVIICGRTQETLDQAMIRFPALYAFTCDLALEADRRGLFDCAREHFPGLNVLVNNAAVAEVTDLTHSSAAERVETELSVDLQAPVLLTLKFLPHLLRQRHAAIINVTAVLAYMPSARYPAYSAAKAGLHSFSLSLRHQLQDTLISVFEVLPSAVDTRLNKEDVPKLSPRQVADQVLLGLNQDVFEIRIGQTQKLYTMARFLPRAAFSLLNY
jgi:uncharacterized oxidoreductase